MPSTATCTAAPAAGAASLRKSAEGSATPSAGRRPGHLEDPELVGGAEAVLGGAQRAVEAVAVALELQHRVDHVLQHPGAGDRALLGDVADEEDGGAGVLGQAQEAARRLAHLAHAARRRRERVAVERLHGVDDDERRARRRRRPRGPTPARSRRARRCRRGRSQMRSARILTCAADSSPQTSSAGRPAATLSSTCSSSVDLPMPGSPPTSTSEPGHDAAAEHAGRARRCRCEKRSAADETTSDRRTGPAALRRRPRHRVLRGRGRAALGAAATTLFDERVPGAAVRAVAEPLGLPAAALAAGEDGLRLRHGQRPSGRASPGAVTTPQAPADAPPASGPSLSPPDGGPTGADALRHRLVEADHGQLDAAADDLAVDGEHRVLVLGRRPAPRCPRGTARSSMASLSLSSM